MLYDVYKYKTSKFFLWQFIKHFNIILCLWTTEKEEGREEEK